MSLKKVETSPEKWAKWSNTAGGIGKLSAENLDNVSDKICDASRSEINETVDPSSTSRNTEGNSVTSNVKKNFVRMSIVEKLEQKIQGIKDIQGEENGEKSDSFVTEVVGNEIIDGSAESDSHGSISETVDNDKTKIADSSCKDYFVNAENAAESVDSENIVAQTVLEMTDTNTKDNIPSKEKSNTTISTNIKPNTLLSACPSEPSNQMVSERKRDLFQEKLKLTIENCKEKVGATDVSEDQAKADESTDPDTMDTDEEMEPLKLDLDQTLDGGDEEMETEDSSSQIFSESSLADESIEGASLDNAGIVNERVVQNNDDASKAEIVQNNDEASKAETSDNNNHTVKSGNDDAYVLSSDDSPDKIPAQKTVDQSSKEVIDVSDSGTEDCCRIEEKSKTRNNLEAEQELIEKELKIFDEVKMDTSVISEQKKELQDANILERNTNLEADKSSTGSKETSNGGKTSDNEISKNASQENNQILNEETTEKVFKTSTKSIIPDSDITMKNMKNVPIRTNVAEVVISEDDSDIERLVIDLDSEKEYPSKFSGEVRNTSGFKHGPSPLVSPSSSKSDTTLTNNQSATKTLNSESDSVKGRNASVSDISKAKTITTITKDSKADSQKGNGVTDDHIVNQKKGSEKTAKATEGVNTALSKSLTPEITKTPAPVVLLDLDSKTSRIKYEYFIQSPRNPTVNIIFSSTGGRPASLCHGPLSVCVNFFFKRLLLWNY